MDLDIVETAPAEVAGTGSTTAPAHTLYEIVRKLPEGAQVELDSDDDDGMVILRSGRSRFSLAALPTQDFPVMAEGELPYAFTLPAAELRGIIDHTRFAISTEETRYYLNGIYLHATENNGVQVLRAVATDGHAWRASRSPCPRGHRACQASSCRARRSANCAS